MIVHHQIRNAVAIQVAEANTAVNSSFYDAQWFSIDLFGQGGLNAIPLLRSEMPDTTLSFSGNR